MTKTDEQTDSGPRIAAIVINSISHDARVLKEADGLAAAGYRVTLYGIQDNRCVTPYEVRASGVVIRRAEWKSRSFVLRAQLLRGFAFVCMLFAVAAVILAATLQAGRPLVGWFFVLASIPAWLVVAARVRQSAAASRATADRLAAIPEASVSAEMPTSLLPAAEASVSSVRSALRVLRRWFGRQRAKSRKLAARLSTLNLKLRTRFIHRLRARAILELVLEDRPDAVHAHDLQALPIGWWVKKRLGVPLVFDSHELHDDLSLISRWGKRESRRQHRFYSRRIDGLVTVNDSIGAALRERYPLLPEPVIVRNATRYDGADIVDDGRLHRAAEVDPSTRILLYQGGFSRHRGLDVLVRSAPLLPSEWVLVMMGWGSFESHLRALAREVDPGGTRVRFIPGAPQAELGLWTAGGALGVIPYENVCLNHWFCSPNKLWEYPVAGVPILASPFPELRATVEDNDIGCLLSDPVTPENIAETIRALTGEQLVRWRANCRRFIERDNWSVYEQRLVALYARLLKSEPKRSGSIGTETLSSARSAPIVETARVPASAGSGGSGNSGGAGGFGLDD